MTEAERLALAAAIAAAAGLPPPTDVAETGHGMSGDTVLRLDGCYAKVVDPARKANIGELFREWGMLQWLRGRVVRAPEVAWFGEAAGRAVLVTRALAGVALHELTTSQSRTSAVAAIAALSALHGMRAELCPYDERLDVKLAEARRRVATGEVDLANLQPENRGRSPHALFAELLARRPEAEDLVVTHGDACWPNFVLGPDGLAGVIDLGRGGVADRHQDLALFIRSGAHNFPGLPIRDIVAAHYAAGPIDAAKLDFYRQLDEFF